MRVIGYTYEADFHCSDCAEARFGDQALDDPATVDGEGNSIHPVFSTDELEPGESCGDCAVEL